MGVRIHFRIKWAAAMAVICLVSGLVLLLALKLFLSQRLSSDSLESLFALKTTQTLLFTAIGFSVLLFVVIYGILAALITVYISHHISWPLHQLELFTESLERGDLRPPAPGRPADQLKELTRTLDNLRGDLAGQVKSLHEAFDRIDASWLELDKADEKSHDAKAKEILERIDSDLLLIHKALGRPS